jgi:hypothetical protein
MKTLKQLAAVAIGKLTAAFPVNRVVTILTPLVFAPAAGYIAAWVPQHIPGLGFEPTSAQVLGLIATGAGTALVAAYKWLAGWQRAESEGRI